MANKTEFTFPSKDGVTTIYGYIWKGDGEPKAILQIVHGMIEHLGRYDAWAEFLVEQGYIVVGNDHLGHGKSIQSENHWGYFCEGDAVDVLVEDAHTTRELISKDYPDIPYFILGHSMGSFVTRVYLSRHGEGLAGAIVMGTADMSNSLISGGKFMTKVVKAFHNGFYRSKFLNDLVINGNDKKFTNDTYSKSWLTKNKEIVDIKAKDPAANYLFTTNGILGLMDIIATINKPETFKATPVDLPMLLVSGADDLLGDRGEGIKRVYKKYQAAGIKDLTWQLFATDRHEILNELDKDKVYNDLLAWLNVHLEIQ